MCEDSEPETRTDDVIRCRRPSRLNKLNVRLHGDDILHVAQTSYSQRFLFTGSVAMYYSVLAKEGGRHRDQKSWQGRTAFSVPQDQLFPWPRVQLSSVPDSVPFSLGIPHHRTRGGVHPASFRRRRGRMLFLCRYSGSVHRRDSWRLLFPPYVVFRARGNHSHRLRGTLFSGLLGGRCRARACMPAVYSPRPHAPARDVSFHAR